MTSAPPVDGSPSQGTGHAQRGAQDQGEGQDNPLLCSSATPPPPK